MLLVEGDPEALDGVWYGLLPAMWFHIRAQQIEGTVFRGSQSAANRCHSGSNLKKQHELLSVHF